MAIETTCGGCGKQLSVSDEHTGRRARCPACGQIYTIPSPTVAPPDLPPQPQSLTSGSFAENSAGSDSGAPAPSLPDSASAGLAGLDQFWMRSTEGAEYGPVDRITLNRWFNEGRVGPGYMMRQSETGMWQSAELFKPNARPVNPQSGSAQPAGNPFASNSANPYAQAPTSSAAMAYGPMFPKADQSGLVLAFGILSWFICPIFGVLAWIMGSSGLHDIRLGLVDPANKGLMQAGYYLGMVNVILYLLCGGGYFVFVALAVVLGAMS